MWDVLERAVTLLGFLGVLDLVPVREHFVGRACLSLGEDVRVSMANLLGDAAGDVVDVETALIRGYLRVQNDLQKHVAELFAELGVAVRLDGRNGLVGLFDHVLAQTAVRLHAVPRAPVGAAQDRYDANELAERGGAVSAALQPRVRPRMLRYLTVVASVLFSGVLSSETRILMSASLRSFSTYAW